MPSPGAVPSPRPGPELGASNGAGRAPSPRGRSPCLGSLSLTWRLEQSSRVDCSRLAKAPRALLIKSKLFSALQVHDSFVRPRQARWAKSAWHAHIRIDDADLVRCDCERALLSALACSASWRRGLLRCRGMPQRTVSGPPPLRCRCDRSSLDAGQRRRPGTLVLPHNDV